jgi:hypothetical protein
MKYLGREFQSNSKIIEAIYDTLKEDHEFKLRVPLMTIIDYKGFRALVYSENSNNNSIK